MWRPFAVPLMLALAVTIIPTAPAQAQAVRVIVDGAPVLFDQPPAIIGGRTLIPLRGVFEQMGATVQWNPLNNTVLAVRGATQVQLRIGSRIAYVDGRQTVLDVPPMILGGRTLVPLRFISEALGADVQWMAATRTVLITSPLARPPLPPAGRPPLPIPAQTTIEGTVVQVDVPNQRLFVQRGNQVHTVLITADTAITRVSATTGQGGAAALADLRVGDQVTVTMDALGRAILVRAQVREVSGRIDMVRITSFTHSATRPLRAGETLAVELRGTPGGQATFDIFNVAAGVPMTEVAPGVYRGTFTVPSGASVTDAAVFGHLRSGGREAVIQAGAPVTIDAKAPAVTGRFPQPGTVVENLRPNIIITYADTGSGVNPQATTLTVNGQNVTADATVTETAIAYMPPANLPQGAVAVRAVIRDRAGNQTVDAWSFSVGVAQGALIRAVTLSPPGALQVGQTVTVTALGEAGGQAAFTIEGLAADIPMVEVQPGVYVGQFTVGPQHNVQNARVLVTLSRGGRRQTAAASARLTLIGQPGLAPVITSPAPDASVGSPIVIRGTALPGSRVIVRVDFQGALLVFPIRGSYGEVTTTADAGGNWQVSITPSFRIPNARLTITARAIDPLGRESSPAQVQVTQS